jgi:hypothetical protein
MSLPIPEFDDAELVCRRIRVSACDVGFIRGILEASEGLASMFAERGGDLLLVASVSRERELDVLVDDLRVELGAIVTSRSGRSGRRPEPSENGAG